MPKPAVVAVLILLSVGAVTGQSPPSPPLYPTHPAEPVVPVQEGASLEGAAVSINPTTWTSLGPAPIVNGQRPGSGPVSGRLTGIAAHPTDPNTIYIAAAGGGVWKTTNGGSTWTSLTDSQATQSMGAIAIAPSNPSVIYAGTGEANNSGDSNFGRGILVSTDAGANWTLMTGPSGFFNTRRLTTSQIVVDPTDSATAYAAMADIGVNGLFGSNTGIWKTTNTGSTWTNMTAAVGLNSSDPWSSVDIDPSNHLTVYAALSAYYAIATAGIYKSTNGGATWALLTNAPNGSTVGRTTIAVARSNPQVVYASIMSLSPFGSLGRFVRSDNGGSTFADLTAGTPNYMGGQGWYDTTLAVDPANAAIVYAGGAAGTNSIIRSTNSGVSWTGISSGSDGSGPHVDHHAAAFDASGRYLDGDDGGIFLLDTTSPAHWTQLNGNLSTIQFQGIAVHPTDVNIAFGGSQDNGTEKYAGTTSWTLVEGGDGGFVKFSKTNPNRVYHQAPVASFGGSGFFRRSDNGGSSWVSKVTGITDNTSSLQNFYSPFVVDPGNGDRVLYGARHVWETTNGGDTWTALGAAFANNVTTIGLAPSDSNTVYAASSASSLSYTNNHGATWTTRTLPVIGTVRDIQVSSSNPLVAYIVFGSFTTGGNVYKTTDGGASFSNVSVPPGPDGILSGLPSLPAWSLQIDPNTPGRLFLGADDGVYVTTNDGGTWTRFGGGLPTAQVFQIELSASLHILAAGTHGRGMWEISLSTPFTDDPIISGVTAVKAIHITELRTRVDAARARSSLPPYPWTDPTLTQFVTLITAQHVVDLRSALNNVYSARGMALPTYTNVVLIPGTSIVKAVDITELRRALIAVE